MLKADLGRGVEAYLMGVTPENRLPLRAYHAALILKNGIPIGYFEGLSIFERMESGFNLYYTFRDGETAWLYARTLRLMRQLLGVTVFSIDPYQIGHENEEGIESGAFWFYRKLGFRPVLPELLKLTLSEEQKLATRRGYRTSAAALRKLAAGHLIFDSVESGSGVRWDQFQVRKVALKVQRRMASEFNGEAERLRAYSIEFVRRELGPGVGKPDKQAWTALEDLALVIAMVPGLRNWNPAEKRLAARIVRAKAGRDEALYLRLMQQHRSFRAAICKLGS